MTHRGDEGFQGNKPLFHNGQLPRHRLHVLLAEGVVRIERVESFGGEVGHLRLPCLVTVQLAGDVLDALLQGQDGVTDVQVAVEEETRVNNWV